MKSYTSLFALLLLYFMLPGNTYFVSSAEVLEINTDLIDGETYTGEIEIIVESNIPVKVIVYLDKERLIDLDLSEQKASFTFDSTAVSNGKHLFAFEAIDEEENTAYLEIEIIIDNLPDLPHLIYHNVTDQGTYNESVVFVFTFDQRVYGNIALSDNLLHLISNTSQVILTIDTTEYANGQYLLLVTYQDVLDNLNSANFTIFIENLIVSSSSETSSSNTTNSECPSGWTWTTQTQLGYVTTMCVPPLWSTCNGYYTDGAGVERTCGDDPASFATGIGGSSFAISITLLSMFLIVVLRRKQIRKF